MHRYESIKKMAATADKQQHINLFRRSLEQAARPETFKKLCELVAPRVLPGKRNLVYVLYQIDRIGQLSGELLHIKTLFETYYDRIIIVTGPINNPHVNPNVFKVLGPKFINVVTEDPIVPLIGVCVGEHRTLSPNLDLLIWDANQLWDVFRKEFIQGTPLATFQLPNSMRLKGEAWMKQTGLDPSIPTVLLHVRDIRYRPDLSHHGHRCVDICNYRSAIMVLVEKGYQVVRVGDSSNKPLEDYPASVIDLPFHPLYENFLDVYFAATCVFAVNQSSGPSQLIRGFEKPTLMVNRVVDWDINAPSEVLLFKHYICKSTSRRLTYNQILERGLGELTMDQEFEKAGVLLEENSSDELKMALEEFIETLEGRNKYSTETRDRFTEIGRKHELRIQDDIHQNDKKGRKFGFAYSRGNLSQRPLEVNTEFLN